jgi:hypothetical protein
MSGRTYAVTFNAVAVSAAQDMFEITPADDKPCEIVSMHLGQYSDAGDAAAELLGISIVRGFTASGSGGSSATPAPMDPGSSAAGFTAEVNNTTVANTGTTTTLHSDAFNVQAGYNYIPPLDARPKVNQGNTSLVVRITAPADALTMNGTLIVREL